MTTWKLRRFDKDLASTGFTCIMLTGSHSEGTLIEDTSPDIKDGNLGIGVATVSLGFCSLVVNGVTYTFDYNGTCKTDGNRQYRLMLGEQSQSTSIEEILGNVVTVLGYTNDKLNAINNTLAVYCNQVQETIESLQQQIDDIEGRIPDISGLASRDYVDGEIQDVNDRIDSYHPQR